MNMTGKILALVLATLAFAGAAKAQTAPPGSLNAAALIANFESSDNPTATNPTSTASGLFGFTNATWAQFAPQAGISLAQCPTAASCSAADQTATFFADFDQNGFADWTCANCDPAAAAAIAADGGASAFAQGSTNPATFASLDTPAGLASGLAFSTDTDLATGVTTAGTSTATITDTPATAGATGTAPITEGALSNGMAAGTLDNLTETFSNLVNGISTGLASDALNLFGILATIEFFVMIFGLYMAGERPVWSDVVLHITRYLIVVGLFLWLMNNGSTFMADIVNSIKGIGPAIGATALTPSSIWAAGNNAATALAAQGTWSVNPFFFVPLGLAAFVLEITFALLVAWMVIALLEAFFVIGFAALFLAFGALRWAREIAVSVIRYSIGIGMKLLAIEVIAGVFATFINTQIANPQNLNVHGAWTLVGIAVLMCAIGKFVPDTLARVITGSPSSLAHPSQLVSAVALAAAPVAIAAGGAGLAAGAGQLAYAELQAAKLAGTAPEGALGQAAMMLGSMNRSTASAGGRAIINSLGARTGGRHVFWRAAADLGHQARVVDAEAQRPSPPAGSA
jgi:P-type conjugative transfer protein TrbL